MGIFLSWIIQKRWITGVAFVVLLVSAFTVARAPLPWRYAFALAPGLFLMAILYEGVLAFPVLRHLVTDRQRLAMATWMGLVTVVFLLGVMLVGDGGFVAILIVSSVLYSAGIIAPAIAVRRRLRNEQRPR
ncbi:MAG TPA: hypothetical protein VEQ13_01505 [Methylomirabilota bacterium]|nr:hypothetical protein [Methylomirabilota bacterium]